MQAFIIEAAGEIKEAFSYERQLIEASRQGLVEYARATYGPDALVRQMTPKEQRVFVKEGAEFLITSVKSKE